MFTTRGMAALAAVGLTALATGAKADSIYSVDFSDGGASIIGTLTTDGATGALATSDIVDYNIVLTDPFGSFDLLGPDSGNNSAYESDGGGLGASTTTLSYDFDLLGANFQIQNPHLGSGINGFCLGCGGGEFEFVTSGPITSVPESGIQTIGTIGTAVPEPATLSLLGLGLAAVGFVRRRRKH